MDTDIHLRFTPGCGSASGKVACPHKTLCASEKSDRAWYKLRFSTLVECGFKQCLVDSCAFLLRVTDDVVAIMVFHVDDIMIAATEGVIKAIVGALNQRFSTKHLGAIEWYICSDYKRYWRFHKLNSIVC